MQQHLISTNYPGLLDGLMTSQVFPDHMDQVMGSLDCRALMHYFWPHAALHRPALGAGSPPVSRAPRPPSAPSAALTGSALGTANPLFSTSAARLPVWGSNPTNGDNLC